MCPDWEIRSAGTVCGSPGSIVPKKWREPVEGWTEPHQARKVTEDDIKWADVVVCVQESHRKAAQAIRPDVTTVLRRIPDPAYHRVEQWPTLTSETVRAAGEIVDAIREQRIVGES